MVTSREVKKTNAAALAQYASQLTGGGREMIDVLVNVARSPLASNAERIAAAREVLDRTCGRSAQVIEHDVHVVGGNYDLSRLPAERVRELRSMLVELAGAAGSPAPSLPGVIDAVSVDLSEPELILDEEDVEGEP